jgi:hypothetical protein
VIGHEVAGVMQVAPDAVIAMAGFWFVIAIISVFEC